MTVETSINIVTVDHQLGSCSSAWRARWKRVMTHTHTFSGRADHGGTITPPESYQRLSRWAARLGIDAMGMGSPYTPATARTYHLYDNEGRNDYYGGGVDQKSLCQLDDITQMLREIQQQTRDGTLFYLDNETPKGRFGHMWWVGYYPDYPAWHDYDQDFDRWMVHESKPGDDSDEPMPYERRPYSQIVALQRQHGAMGFWAHPTSWWFHQGRFITNIASEMPAHLLAEGFVDGMVVMGYNAYRPQYLALWHKLLDAGFKVPAVAEMDAGLSSPKTWDASTAYLNNVCIDGGSPHSRLPLRRYCEAFRSGNLFASSGPMLNLSIDGVPMGSVALTSADHIHKIEIEAYPSPKAQSLDRVELLGHGGQVLWREYNFPGGRVVLQMPGLTDRGYLVLRAFGQPTNTGNDFHAVHDFAVGNPVYLHPAGQSFEKPLLTELTVHVPETSRFSGGIVRFEDAAGQLLEAGTLRGPVTLSVPAHSRVTLLNRDGQTVTRYLINANPRLMAAQRYLYRGRFLRDFPDAQSGEVPVDAWRLDDFRQAMLQLTLNIADPE